MTKEEYQSYLKSARWRVVRAVRVFLDGGRCLFCFAADGERDKQGRQRWIEVHHRDYRWCNKGWLAGLLREVADTGTYCNVCHRAVHGSNSLLDFLDMTHRPSRKVPILLFLFTFFVILGIVYALYGGLAVVLAVLASGYTLSISLFFYRL